MKLLQLLRKNNENLSEESTTLSGLITDYTCKQTRTQRGCKKHDMLIGPCSYFLFFLSAGGLLLEPDLSKVFCPDHKAAMVLFLDRVYGIENQSFLLHLVEVGFLPDLQTAVSLDSVSRKSFILLLSSPA